jgi:hypothetical protein
MPKCEGHYTAVAFQVQRSDRVADSAVLCVARYRNLYSTLALLEEVRRSLQPAGQTPCVQAMLYVYYRSMYNDMTGNNLACSHLSTYTCVQLATCMCIIIIISPCVKIGWDPDTVQRARGGLISGVPVA